MANLDPSTDNNLLFKEKVADVYVNLASTYANIVAYLYDEHESLVEKWSRENQSGYKTIFVVDNETVELYIYRELLADKKGRRVHLEIKVIQDVPAKGLTSNEEHTVYETDLTVGSTKMESLK